jgi:hypothetical protein
MILALLPIVGNGLAHFRYEKPPGHPAWLFDVYVARVIPLFGLLYFAASVAVAALSYRHRAQCDPTLWGVAVGSTVLVFILACCACVAYPVLLWAFMDGERPARQQARQRDSDRRRRAHEVQEAQPAPLLGEDAPLLDGGARRAKADGTPVVDDPPPQLVDPHAFMGALVGQHA